MVCEAPCWPHLAMPIQGGVCQIYCRTESFHLVLHEFVKCCACLKYIVLQTLLSNKM